MYSLKQSKIEINCNFLVETHKICKTLIGTYMYTNEFIILPSFIIHVCAHHKQLMYHVSKTTCTFKYRVSHER